MPTFLPENHHREPELPLCKLLYSNSAGLVYMNISGCLFHRPATLKLCIIVALVYIINPKEMDASELAPVEVSQLMLLTVWPVILKYKPEPFASPFDSMLIWFVNCSLLAFYVLSAQPFVHNCFFWSHVIVCSIVCRERCYHICKWHVSEYTEEE